jgi:hypothetical protein
VGLLDKPKPYLRTSNDTASEHGLLKCKRIVSVSGIYHTYHSCLQSVVEEGNLQHVGCTALCQALCKHDVKMSG